MHDIGTGLFEATKTAQINSGREVGKSKEG
jgi:hypothetical protein